MSALPAKFSDIASICTAAEGVIGTETALTVDGRSLHQGLKVGRDFTNWIKDRIKQLGLVENVDFEKLAVNKNSPELAKSPPMNGRPLQDYILSLDAAKHIAMVEKNEQGHLIRSYFIWVEKQARSSNHPLTAQVTGGIIKTVSRSVFREEFAPVLEEMRNLIVTHQTGTSVVNAKSAKEWCVEYGCIQKGRNGPRRQIGQALSALAMQQGIICKRCARTGTWLYPAELARPYMETAGRNIIRRHNNAVLHSQPDLGLEKRHC